MGTSPYGKIERDRDNNHGTFYDLNMALQAMYVGDEKKARETIQSYIKNRLPRQFKPDGTQFYEMKRANNYYYHRANLMAAFDIAQLADHFDDIDLWNHKTAEGAGLGKAVEFLIPFLTRLKKWPYFAGDEFKASSYGLWSLLRRAAVGFKNYSFEKYADEISGYNELFLINLTYPRAAIPGSPDPDIGKNIRSRLFLLDADHLALTKELRKKGNRLITSSIKGLLGQAKLALRKGPYAVTDKEFLPPSGDKHDFFAYLAYSWPNPKTKDGLPWIFRDGHSNSKAKLDWNRFFPMSRAVHVLALAYYFTGKEAYARHAALLLRTWFINKATRMNPNANYSKMFPGVNQGGYPVAGFGYVFREIYDAAGILESSFSWTDQDRKALQQWTREFIH